MPKFCVTQRVVLNLTLEAHSENEAEERVTQQVEKIVREILNSGVGREGILSMGLGETETTDCVEVSD